MQQSGFEICKSVRKTLDVPIIFLTSRTDSMDESNGMHQGEIVPRIELVIKVLKLQI